MHYSYSTESRCLFIVLNMEDSCSNHVADMVELCRIRYWSLGELGNMDHTSNAALDLYENPELTHSSDFASDNITRP
jgi:hypothetical protein